MERVARLRQVLGEMVAGHMLTLEDSIDAALGDVLTRRRNQAAEPSGAYPLVRRRLLQSIGRKVRHYHLADEVRAFTITAADAETPAGLDMAQLQALDAWLDQVIDRYEHACDSPDAPPAR